jgi:hypothetical protein
MHGVRRTYRRLRNHFGRTQQKLLGDDAEVDARFIPFRDSANLDAR